MTEQPQSVRAYDVAVKRFGAPIRMVERNVALGVAPVVILPNNPRRVHWQIINLSGLLVYVSWAIQTVAGDAIPIVAAGGLASMAVEEDGEAVGYALYGQSPGGAANLHILEVMLR